MMLRNSRKVLVELVFLPFLEDALARFAYLNPTVQVEIGPPITLAGPAGLDLAEAVRDFQFTLCRQKIYAETQSVRSALIHGVMGR
ncbi:hypothetical protein [Pararhizobium sp. DWP1-1-3]|uniref:hypothetical protein n=1 Tax=Pararhizobium sp. DWP1-1-3 TaxID=2804652 RepID=UPI003CFA6CE9